MTRRPPLPKSLPLPGQGATQLSLFEEAVTAFVAPAPEPPLRLTPEQRKVVAQPPPVAEDLPQPPVLGPLGRLNDQQENDYPPPARAFDGKTYDPLKDYGRLKQQMRDVWDVLSDDSGAWRTLEGIQARILSRTGRRHSESSISARLRDLRKVRYGSYDVQRIPAKTRGLFLYRLNPEQLAQRRKEAGQ